MSFFGVSYFSGFWFFLNLTFALIAAQCYPAETSETGKITEARVVDSPAAGVPTAAPTA
jgi:hypothetical protein